MAFRTMLQKLAQEGLNYDKKKLALYRLLSFWSKVEHHSIPKLLIE